ncbi:hypothetical protein TPA0909_46450 [Streptomyces albus]|nr:hypothetical protein TPA0909_46450 [Streptomyces albus]
MHARRMTGRTVWHRSVDFRPPGREGTATTRSAAGSTYGIRAGYVRGCCREHGAGCGRWGGAASGRRCGARQRGLK